MQAVADETARRLGLPKHREATHWWGPSGGPRTSGRTQRRPVGGEVMTAASERRGPNALVVSEDFVRRNRWAAALRANGLQTATCPGPFVTEDCPRMDGELCPLREWAHVAVVDVPPGLHTELYGGMPERACTTLPDDTRTVFVYHSPLPSDWHHARRTLPYPVHDSELLRTVRAAAGVI
jgi:hypothetical protein